MTQSPQFVCNSCNKKYIKKNAFDKHIINCKLTLNDKTAETDTKMMEVDIQPPAIHKVKEKLNGNEMEKIHQLKPILKWVGGKTQIISSIIGGFPIVMENYHEIFLGGGSVLLALLTYVQQNIIHVKNKIYAYDLNEPLIYLYKNIQSAPNQLYDEIQILINDFKNCGKEVIINRAAKTRENAMLNQENYYYWVRGLYNGLSTDDKKTCRGSALFLFLNKTCFRGVFRMGPNGFNVPYGHYNSPEIINHNHLFEMHALIQPVVFECCDFTNSIAKARAGDFMYLDPPYAPETSTSFVGYTEKGFDISMHEELFNMLHTATNVNIKFMMSNADVSLVRASFNNTMYNLLSIECRRAINQKKPDAKTQEVIIVNY